MKKILLVFGIFFMLIANAKEIKGENMQNQKEIYLAGGCFWGMEGYFKKIPGILQTSVGYANGKTSQTSYQELSKSDHAETLKIKFDENVISLIEILAHYFRIIDPISINKQGNDTGRQYRSGIYYNDENMEKYITKFISYEQNKYKQKIAVEVQKLKNFILAEDYHQDYLDKNPSGYCHIDLSLSSKPLYAGKFKKPSQDEIKNSLSELQYNVTQYKQTEAPFSSKFDKFNQKGIYVDIVTKQPLFSSKDKFDAGCGWPSFSKPITTDVIKYNEDLTHGMQRTEVSSKLGNSHLGHVFDDGIKEKGGLRYCINGASLEFIPIEKMKDMGYEDYILYVE